MYPILAAIDWYKWIPYELFINDKKKPHVDMNIG